MFAEDESSFHLYSATFVLLIQILLIAENSIGNTKKCHNNIDTFYVQLHHIYGSWVRWDG